MSYGAGPVEGWNHGKMESWSSYESDTGVGCFGLDFYSSMGGVFKWCEAMMREWLLGNELNAILVSKFGSAMVWLNSSFWLEPARAVNQPLSMALQIV